MVQLLYTEQSQAVEVHITINTGNTIQILMKVTIKKHQEIDEKMNKKPKKKVKKLKKKIKLVKK